MVVGMDSFQDMVISMIRDMSVVGFVAIMNKHFTRFFSDVLIQTRGQELMDGLQFTFTSALKHCNKGNGCLPETVVVYRDSAGDGQLDIVRQYEVEKMKAVFKKLRDYYTVDFYIDSQSVRQGTVSPTCYIVVYDTLNLLPANLQKLMYKLCHVYFNWPGTIRGPAPCQYAPKLAFLTGESLHKEPAKDLANILFFL